MNGGPFSTTWQPTTPSGYDRLEWFGNWCDACGQVWETSPCAQCGNDDLRQVFVEKRVAS